MIPREHAPTPVSGSSLRTVFLCDSPASTDKEGASWRARLVTAGLGGLLALCGVWFAVHHVPGVGSAVADSLRAALGTDNVAKLEDAVYGMRDSVNLVLREGEAPRAHWDVPEVFRAPASDLSSSGPVPEEPSSWDVEDVGPLDADVVAPGDGSWVDLASTAGGVVMRKTLIHPDPKRAWAELFVVAIDLEAVDLKFVAGTVEPSSEAPGSEQHRRFGKIPSAEHSKLLGAFNGGFKTRHGHFGAMADGITLVNPKPHSCTLARTRDGTLTLGTWKNLSSVEQQFSWYRQTPGCLVENGELHPGVSDGTKNWGATLDGETVIRRSAIGMSEEGKTLFMGISNDTTARALAEGMRHVGAHNVAQLDVNYSYPRFVTYREDQDGELAAESIVDGFVVSKHHYLEPEARDFFYLVEK